MQNQKVIEQLGYTPKEAKVYLTALALGEAHISDIAEKAHLPRSSAQVIVDKLHTDGLMTFYVMRRYKYWVAENPDRILANLERREQNVRDAIPGLQKIRKQARSNRRNKKNDKKQLTLFRMLANASPQPVLITNEQADIKYVNAAWEEQFGYSLREVAGHNPRIFKSGKTPPEVYARMWSALSKDKMFQSDEIIDKRKDGSFFNLLTTIFPLSHNGRRFYVQILDDITETKRATRLTERFIGIAEETKK